MPPGLLGGGSFPTLWEVQTSGVVLENWGAIASDGSRLVALVGQVAGGGAIEPNVNFGMYSDDGGDTWTTMTVPTVRWIAIAYGGGVFVAVSQDNTGAYNQMKSTDNGLTWTGYAPPALLPAKDWSRITYGNGVFVAASINQVFDPGSGNYGNLWYSSDDGATWTLGDLGVGTTTWWRGLAYGAGTFVAVGPPWEFAFESTDQIAYSTDDGVSWTPVTIATGLNLNDVIYDGTNFIAIGIYSGGSVTFVYTSPDGITWTPRIFTPTVLYQNWTSLCAAGGKVIAVSTNGNQRAAISLDSGVTWAIQACPLFDSWHGLAFAASKFCAVGNYSTYYNKDGPQGPEAAFRVMNSTQ
jgi:hypothetical protein